MQNTPTDITLMYRYETASYPNAVYIEPGPFSRFKSLLHDQGFVAIGGLAVLLGSVTIVAMNQKKISNVSKRVTRYFKNLIYGRPPTGTDHIVPIVPKRVETEAPAAIENKPETPKVEEVAEEVVEEPVEAPVAAVETAAPAAPAPVAEQTKVCTPEEKAACTNDCSQCPNNGDIENIKKFSCKEGGVCDCSALPKDPQMKPIAVDLSDGGAKWICRCSRSAKFPYCDGAHKAYNAEHGTSITPMKVDKESTGKDTVYVCACGHAQGRPENPFCDGTHRRVKEVSEPVVAEPAAAEPVAEVVAPAEPVAEVVAAPAEPVAVATAEPVAVATEESPVVVEAPVEAVSSSAVSESTVVVDAPVEQSNVEVPVEAAPVEVAPVEAAPVQEAAVEVAPVEVVAPVEEAPVQQE